MHVCRKIQKRAHAPEGIAEWPNITYCPPGTGKWVRCSTVANEVSRNSRAAWSGNKRLVVLGGVPKIIPKPIPKKLATRVKFFKYANTRISVERYRMTTSSKYRARKLARNSINTFFVDESCWPVFIC